MKLLLLMHKFHDFLARQNWHCEVTLSFNCLHVGIALFLRPRFLWDMSRNLLVKNYHNPEKPPVILSLPCTQQLGPAETSTFIFGQSRKTA